MNMKKNTYTLIWVILIATSCTSYRGKESTIYEHLQKSLVQEATTFCSRDSCGIVGIYAICLENGAVRAVYNTNEKDANSSELDRGSKVFPGSMMEPVFSAILADSNLPRDERSIDLELNNLLSSIKNVFKDSDCLIPRNLSLPAEKERAIALCLQGRCHQLSGFAFDCLANNGSAFAPFHLYNGKTKKTSLCSPKTASQICQSLEEFQTGQNTVRFAYGTSDGDEMSRASIVAIIESGRPITIYVSIRYRNNTNEAISWPDDGISVISAIMSATNSQNAQRL